MALGERINFFRRKNNMTMNYLGRLLGFTPKSADVRMIDGEICLRLNKQVTQPGTSLWNSIEAWADEKDKLNNGDISLSEYDEWRYNYPRDDHSQIRAHVIPQELSDAILEGLKSGELTVQEKPIKRKTRKNFKRKGLPEQHSEE